jgi:photosystem II stability/assembly factor-like uncharacterized protein
MIPRLPYTGIRLLAAILLLFLLHHRPAAAQQWVPTGPPDAASNNLYGIHVASGQRVYAVGWGNDGSIFLKSTDGGGNWETTGFPGTLLFSTLFRDANTGYMAGYSGDCNCGLVMKSTDGGERWSSTTYPGSFGFYQVAFLDSVTGFVCGYGGTIARTTDAGATWKPMQTGTADVFRRIFFPSRKTGYAIAGPGNDFSRPSKIYKSVDSGATWTLIQDYTDTRVFGDLWFTSDDTGVLVGNDGVEAIYRTTNGGADWARVYAGSPGLVLQGVTFDNAIFETWFAVGDSGHILRGMNDGALWRPEKSRTSATLIAVGIDGETGYAAGFGGEIVRRTVEGLGVEEVSGSDGGLTIAPNPISGGTGAAVSGIPPGRHVFHLYDALGREVRRVDGVSGSFLLERGDLPAGAYFYRLTGDRGLESRGMLRLR